jgi:hypothetical protein
MGCKAAIDADDFLEEHGRAGTVKSETDTAAVESDD